MAFDALVYFIPFYIALHPLPHMALGLGLFESSQVLNYDLTINNLPAKRFRRALGTGLSTSELCKKDSLEKIAEKEILKFPYPLRNDRNMDLQLVFLGENFETQVLLTTMAQTVLSFFISRQKSSNLYQSTDGGRTFQVVLHRIGSASIRSSYGIMKSPLDNKRVILVSYTASYSPFMGLSLHNGGQKSVLLVSENAGNNFTSYTLPFKLRENEPLFFHPKKKDWIIGLEDTASVFNVGMSPDTETGQAWISKDFGKTWKVMMKGHVASSVRWGSAEGKEGDEIYLATKIKGNAFGSFFSMFFRTSSSLTLWKSSDGGKLFEEIVEHCYNFGVEGNFVFASVTFKDTKSRSGHKRIMHVSKDSGTSFRPVNVPEITADRFYAVMEMHKGMIFLHVDDSQDTGKGTLFISGSDGIMYTKSLDDHFYTNNGYTDFTKIESMHGVYVTQVLQKDNTLKSVITFDRGVTWQPLYIDKKKYCKSIDEPCTLHFHKDFSRGHQHVDVQGPLSSANAPGMIFLHGQAGDALTGSAQVWLSTNGGYNWTKVDDYPHHYAIGDNGNLLVIVPRINNTGNMLKYSIDQGRCWHNYKFSDDNQELVIRGLVTEPHAQQRTFSLWGYYKDALPNEKEWNVITISFHGMFSRRCNDKDFQEWSPHIQNKKIGCFLGEKLFFRRPRLDVNCYLGNDFDPLLRKSKCKCDNNDLECDYGYERQSDGTCQINKSIKPIEVCKNGEKMKEKFSKGYRRVPGDVCESAEAVDDVVKYIDENAKCSPSKEDAFGIIKEEKKLVEEEKKEKFRGGNAEEEDVREGDNDYQTKIHPLRSKGHGYLIVIAVLVIIGIIVGGGWYGIKHIKKKRAQPAIFSEFTDDLGEGADILYDPKPKNERPFTDETDAEDEALLTV